MFIEQGGDSSMLSGSMVCIDTEELQVKRKDVSWETETYLYVYVIPDLG